MVQRETEKKGGVEWIKRKLPKKKPERLLEQSFRPSRIPNGAPLAAHAEQGAFRSHGVVGATRRLLSILSQASRPGEPGRGGFALLFASPIPHEGRSKEDPKTHFGLEA
jgi:hypothetical protein